jgi:hypothetical protein
VAGRRRGGHRRRRGTFGTNLSGLAYEASGGATPGVLWAVDNGPSTLYRLEWDGTKWTPATTDGWNAGKALHYPDGTGDPDSEGVTLTGAGPAGARAPSGSLHELARRPAAGSAARRERPATVALALFGLAAGATAGVLLRHTWAAAVVGGGATILLAWANTFYIDPKNFLQLKQADSHTLITGVSTSGYWLQQLLHTTVLLGLATLTVLAAVRVLRRRYPA